MVGKVRRKKTRVHASAPKNTVDRTLKNGSREMKTVSYLDPEYSYIYDSVSLSEVVPIPAEFISKLPFISFEKQNLRQVTGGIPEVHSENKITTKKNRRRVRHETWLKKIEVCRLAKEEKKAAERRRNTVIVGDLQPLLLSLPDLESTAAGGQFNERQKKRNGTKMQESQLQRQTMFREVDHFKQVLDHPAFQSNPLGTISEHIKNATDVNAV